MGRDYSVQRKRIFLISTARSITTQGFVTLYWNGSATFTIPENIEQLAWISIFAKPRNSTIKALKIEAQAIDNNCFVLKHFFSVAHPFQGRSSVGSKQWAFRGNNHHQNPENLKRIQELNYSLYHVTGMSYGIFSVPSCRFITNQVMLFMASLIEEHNSHIR